MTFFMCPLPSGESLAVSRLIDRTGLESGAVKWHQGRDLPFMCVGKSSARWSIPQSRIRFVPLDDSLQTSSKVQQKGDISSPKLPNWKRAGKETCSRMFEFMRECTWLIEPTIGLQPWTAWDQCSGYNRRVGPAWTTFAESWGSGLASKNSKN